MRLRACIIVLVLGCVAPPRAAHAEAVVANAAVGIDWPSMANVVIRRVARLRELRTPVAPLAFAEDRAGFLWGGGESGLFRWDGYQFRYYTTSVSPDDGLRDHYVWTLHTDRGGRLWAGTEAGGLARYDDAADRFVPVRLIDARGEASCVWALDDDGDGGLLVATNRGVAHLDAAGRIVKPAGSGTDGGMFAAPDRKVEALARSGDGAVWIGGAAGLARIGADGRVVPVRLPVPGNATPQVSRLMQDGAGRIWAGTRHHGAFVVDPAGLRARPVPEPAGLVTQDGGVEITAMEEIEPGRVWLGTFGQGIIEVTASTLAARAIVRDPMVQDTLDADLVYALHRDRSGITWISTTAALDQRMPATGGIHTLFGNPQHPDGLPTDITGVLARPDGSVWLASQNNGIVILGADGRRLRTIAVPRVFCLAAEAEGPVYIGGRSGLFVASPSGETVRKVIIPSRRPNADVSALAVVGGAVWLGGADDDGVWEIHPTASGAFTVARRFGAPQLSNATILALALTRGGQLAVGMADGAALLDRTTGAVETFGHDAAGGRGIAAGPMVSFLTDRRGRLWIGSNAGGIAVMLGRDAAGRPVFHRITPADGLPDADVNRMVEDAAGRVWVSTDSGLAMIDPDSFAVRSLKEPDGVAITTYWQGAGDRTRQGDVLFGGIGGLTVLRPDSVGAWRYRPVVAISDIHVGGKPVRGGATELVVQPGANSLAVEFAALDLSAPERNAYRYKLEGFDTDYVVTDARHRVAAYTNLPPGRYVLRLEGSNREGAWSAPATLSVRVLPAWFQTVTFRLACVGALVLLGAGAVQGRTAWLRRRQYELERQVRERTADLVSSQERLREMAYLDSLTLLANRRAFNEALQARLEATGEAVGEFALILIDLDGFKHVNDRLGHDAGDAVLVIAAQRLAGGLRAGDFVARLGGDEFAILLGDLDAGGAVTQVCDRVVAAMKVPMELGGAMVQVGASVGVARAPLHGRTAVELYQHADRALYEAKRRGKGVWCWFEAGTMKAA